MRGRTLSLVNFNLAPLNKNSTLAKLPSFLYFLFQYGMLRDSPLCVNVLLNAGEKGVRQRFSKVRSKAQRVLKRIAQLWKLPPLGFFILLRTIAHHLWLSWAAFTAPETLSLSWRGEQFRAKLKASLKHEAMTKKEGKNEINNEAKSQKPSLDSPGCLRLEDSNSLTSKMKKTTRCPQGTKQGGCFYEQR